MIPTLWSLFFDGDELPYDVVRAVDRSRRMELLRGELRNAVDFESTFLHSAEQSIGEALRRVLDVPLVDPLLRAWRTHPALRPGGNGPGYEAITLLDTGEHEVHSTHRPWIEVRGPSGTLGTLELEVRLDLVLQRAILRLDGTGRPFEASIGACRGTGTLGLGGSELARFAHQDIRFPAVVPLPPADPSER